MASETESWEIPIEVGKSVYVVKPTGGELQLGLQAGDTVLWQDETIPVERLPEGARAALEAHDADSTDLRLALTSLVDAFAQRGG